MNPVSTVIADYKKWIAFCPKLNPTDLQNLYKAIKKAKNIGSCSCSVEMTRGDRKYVIKVQSYTDVLEVTHSERTSFLEYLEKHYLPSHIEESLPKESSIQVPSKIKFVSIYALCGFFFQQFLILPSRFGYGRLENDWILTGFVIPGIATFICIRVFRSQFKEEKVLFPTDFLLTLNCCMLMFTAMAFELTAIDVIKHNSYTFGEFMVTLIMVFGGFIIGVILGPLNYLISVLIAGYR